MWTHTLALLAALTPTTPSTVDDATATGSPPVTAQDQALTQQLERAFEAGELHGVAAVARRGKLVARAAAGALAQDAPGPGDLHTPYPLASLSKVFVHACVLRLAADGELDLDDPVRQWLAALVPPTLTVRHLLDGRSGFPREFDEDPRRSGVTLDDDGRVLPWLVRRGVLPTEAEPGVREQYSNVDAWILGAVIEASTDEPYAAALQRLVLTPLGLTDTGFVDDLARRPARGSLPGSPDFTPAEAVDYARRYTSGGLASSAADLLALCAALSDTSLFGPAGLPTLTGDDARLLIGGVLPGHTNALLHDVRRGVTVVLLNNQTIEPPEALLARLEALAVAAGARPIEQQAPRKLVVESAAQGLPSTPLCAAASALDQALRSAERAAVQTWLEEHSSMGDDPADADTIYGLRATLQGWNLVGYLERDAGELFLVARGGNDREARLTLTSSPDSPGLVDELLIEYARRGR